MAASACFFPPLLPNSNLRRSNINYNLCYPTLNNPFPHLNLTVTIQFALPHCTNHAKWSEIVIPPGRLESENCGSNFDFTGGDGRGGDDNKKVNPGGNQGGDGDNEHNGDSDNGDGNKNLEESMAVLSVSNRKLESLPEDLAAAILAGQIPGEVIMRFLELEKSPLFKWLFQFQGFMERLLADDLFLAKVGMECGIGIFAKTLAEYQRRKENFFKEFELVLADVVMAIIADFMLVYLPAPTVSLRKSLPVSAGPIAQFFRGCPDNAFQIALPGSSFSLSQRLGAVMRNGAKLFAVGATSSVVGTVATNVLTGAHKAVDGSSTEIESVPVLSTSAAYGTYMALSSNLRYQVLAGVVEQRILEPLLHQHKLALSALCFAVRTGNTYLGSLLWVDCARLFGIQKASA